MGYSVKYDEDCIVASGEEGRFSFHKANWRLDFTGDRRLYFQFYTKNPPSRFQRWLQKKLLGITWEEIK